MHGDGADLNDDEMSSILFLKKVISRASSNPEKDALILISFH